MSFPLVKSDPYKAKLRRRVRGRRVLWTTEQWKSLVEQAARDDGTFDPLDYPISAGCLELIAEFNRLLAEDDE
jgi:hypothetical protein